MVAKFFCPDEYLREQRTLSYTNNADQTEPNNNIALMSENEYKTIYFSQLQDTDCVEIKFLIGASPLQREALFNLIRDEIADLNRTFLKNFLKNFLTIFYDICTEKSLAFQKSFDAMKHIFNKLDEMLTNIYSLTKNEEVLDFFKELIINYYIYINLPGEEDEDSISTLIAYNERVQEDEEEDEEENEEEANTATKIARYEIFSELAKETFKKVLKNIKLSKKNAEFIAIEWTSHFASIAINVHQNDISAFSDHLEIINKFLKKFYITNSNYGKMWFCRLILDLIFKKIIIEEKDGQIELEKFLNILNLMVKTFISESQLEENKIDIFIIKVQYAVEKIRSVIEKIKNKEDREKMVENLKNIEENLMDIFEISEESGNFNKEFLLLKKKFEKNNLIELKKKYNKIDWKDFIKLVRTKNIKIFIRSELEKLELKYSDEMQTDSSCEILITTKELSCFCDDDMSPIDVIRDKNIKTNVLVFKEKNEIEIEYSDLIKNYREERFLFAKEKEKIRIIKPIDNLEGKKFSFPISYSKKIKSIKKEEKKRATSNQPDSRLFKRQRTESPEQAETNQNEGSMALH